MGLTGRDDIMAKPFAMPELAARSARAHTRSFGWRRPGRKIVHGR